MSKPASGTINSAPDEIKFCSRCGAEMGSRLVGDKLRRACTTCRFIHFTDPKVGVGVFVQQGGNVLLIQRAVLPQIGKWSVPAGYVDRGEDPKETAVREVYEETNLHVEIEQLIDVFHNVNSGGGASIFILYQAKLVGGQLQAGDDASDARFFAPDALPELAFAHTHKTITALTNDSVANGE